MKRFLLAIALTCILSVAALAGDTNSTMGDSTNNYWANNGLNISTEPQPADDSALVEIILVVAIAIPNLLKT